MFPGNTAGRGKIGQFGLPIECQYGPIKVTVRVQCWDDKIAQPRADWPPVLPRIGATSPVSAIFSIGDIYQYNANIG